MVRNKDQGREGLNDNRRGSKGENRQNNNNNLSNRESSLHDDDLRDPLKKGDKGTQSRKGSSGRK